MSNKLKDRIENYLSHSDLKLLPKLPLIISLNMRNASRATQLLTKPYDEQFAEAMLHTTLQLCLQVEGVSFAYAFNDQISLLCRNDQHDNTNPWLDNRVQHIVSICSGIATLNFNRYINQMSLNLTGDCLFSSQVFEVPNLTEAINTFIYFQQSNNFTSIQSACLYNLLTKYDQPTIKEMLTGLTNDEKIELLSQECQINFNDYPLAFKRGCAAYKVPKIVDGQMKNKWHLNTELPIFTKDQSFLSNIFRMGADIFRQESFEQ